MRLSLGPMLPFMIIASTIVIAMIALAFSRSHRFTFYLTLLGIAVAFAALVYLRPSGTRLIGKLFVIDSFASFYSALLLAASFSITLISFDYLERRPEGKEEYYILLLGALLGAMVVVGARHFVSFFLGLEVLSISLYPLIAYQRTTPIYTEAGLKYLVLSAVSSAFLLFGMALVYAITGTMDFTLSGQAVARLADQWPLSVAGIVLLLVGIGFKLGVVPFHMWTPDVYEGAPAPVAAFIATVSKGSIFGLMLRFFSGNSLLDHHQVFLVFAVIAIASMFAGNLLALFQDNLKRVLAYSSIAHFGYLLVAFLSSGPFRATAVTFYLVAYFVTTLGAFGTITLLSSKERDADGLPEYTGLFNRRPWLAAVFVLMLLSLAGMPLTAGFIAKIFVLAAGVDSLLWVLVIALIVNSVIGIFYYLRIVMAIFKPSVPGGASAPPVSPLKGRLLMAVLFILLVWWGVYPITLINLIGRIGVGPSP